VARTGDARAFARSLTTQAENQLWARAPRLAVGAIGPRSQFGRRIKRLIEIAKTGGAPAKYSGRLAFSGFAIVVVIAALATPRILAEEAPPPVEETLAGEPDQSRGFDITRVIRDRDRDVRRDIRVERDVQQFAGDADRFAQDLEMLLAEIDSEVKFAFGGARCRDRRLDQRGAG
jgi:hypothetical protein